MCGRYLLTTPPNELAEAFDAPNPPRLVPRFNVAPSQLVAVVGLKPDRKSRGIAQLKWGLVPHWANSATSGPRPINVRAESVGFKFGELLREKRCLVPADGFFEWATVDGRKCAHLFRMADRQVFAFAGLWDVWSDGQSKAVTCGFLTTTANEIVSAFHDRMPVIIPRESYAEWFNPETPVSRLVQLLKPYPAEAMAETSVGPAVNSPRNDGPECVEAA